MRVLCSIFASFLTRCLSGRGGGRASDTDIPTSFSNVGVGVLSIEPGYDGYSKFLNDVVSPISSVKYSLGPFSGWRSLLSRASSFRYELSSRSLADELVDVAEDKNFSSLGSGTGGRSRSVLAFSSALF
jgi:hypothetical protein